MDGNNQYITKRLKIRYFRENDYLDLYEYLSDKKTYKFEPGNPINIEESKKLCRERAKNKNFWAVELKSEKKLIGHIFYDIVEPKNLKIFEIGYIFNHKYHQKGFATESIQKFIENKFLNTDVHKIIAHCSPKNILSWKLLERLNFKREGKLRKNVYFRKNQNNDPIWLDTYEYGLLVEDLKRQ